MDNIKLIYEDKSKKRVDKFLSETLQTYSRSYIQNLIKEKHLKINGKIVNKNYLLNTKDSIELIIPEPIPLNINPENIKIEIIYEDKNIIVINKPVGMIVHPAGKITSGTLVNALLYHCKELSDINGIIRPGIVHRIDKDTSGILIAAKTNQMHRYLSALFKNHKIKKTYIAVVHGSFAERTGIIKLPVCRSRQDRKKMTVSETGKEAITKFKVIFNSDKFSILKIRLVTGRTHQIRVHLRHINHPVIMDRMYLKNPKNPLPVETSRLMLHSYSIKFFYPELNKEVYFRTENLSAEFNELFEKLKGQINYEKR